MNKYQKTSWNRTIKSCNNSDTLYTCLSCPRRLEVRLGETPLRWQDLNVPSAPWGSALLWCPKSKKKKKVLLLVHKYWISDIQKQGFLVVGKSLLQWPCNGTMLFILAYRVYTICRDYTWTVYHSDDLFPWNFEGAQPQGRLGTVIFYHI